MTDGQAMTMPVTERRLAGTEDLDMLSTAELVRLMTVQDRTVPEAMAEVAAEMTAAVDAISDRMRRGGRLIYLGAGSAGRIGTLDASEIPPTFGVGPDLVRALIAGGPGALISAVEAAEDSVEMAVADLTGVELTELDSVVGLSASGTTPYTVGGVRHARSLGALTVGVACNSGTPLAAAAEIGIEVVVGPELLAGSTRLKAGTAQKLVCNTLSTLVMVRLNRTYGNLMVHMNATNQKLYARAHRLVELITGRGELEVDTALRTAQGSVPVAVLVLQLGVDAAAARRRLAAAGGSLRDALGAVA
ncbi:N-acetylmuramic acid 6-phosphate etherase [Catellatospora sp. KI3]|uniref:N-acetylmuramic acid 6-phosphate etherase n=1 Tax=Catellatospora sp. KI3 TaxID=3041620 RepID=UPI0024823BA8|nr:N-acetylmuramic acid 6-phosphate etherase [Catellatospora sp. KI3]MDI1463108.1 N-acetylmuramic acid 6-phosphate etherase [Catellatospora sp. KI3]